MPNFSKYNNYRFVQSYLQNMGFFNSDIANFRTKEILCKINSNESLLAPLSEILQQVKLTPLRVLKIQLIIQQLLQTNVLMQENVLLVQLLVKVSIKIRKLISSSQKAKTIVINDPEDDGSSNKQIIKEPQSVCENGESLVLKKIIEPVLDLQKRLIFCYGLVCPQEESAELEVSQCWAVINLLKKFVQISPHIQAIGRYYFQEFGLAMIHLIKVLNTDIHKLYRRVSVFLNRKISQYEDLIKLKPAVSIQKQHRTRMNQLMQLIAELQIVDEYIKLLYLSRSFKDSLIANRIAMPSLFTTSTNVDLLRYLEKQFSVKRGNHSRRWKQEGLKFQDVTDV